MAKLNYHVGKLSNFFEVNYSPSLLNFHLSGIQDQYENGALKISKYNEKTFSKIMFKLNRFKGTWGKENWEFKILYYSLTGLLKNEGEL